MAMTLNKVAWGKRDRKLADLVFMSMQKVTPPTVIEWQPKMEHELSLLRGRGIRIDTGELLYPAKPYTPHVTAPPESGLCYQRWGRIARAQP